MPRNSYCINNVEPVKRVNTNAEPVLHILSLQNLEENQTKFEVQYMAYVFFLHNQSMTNKWVIFVLTN